MDPKDKEIADLKAQVATLTTQVTTVTGERDAATKERDTFKADNTKLGEDLKAKDVVIDQKNKDLVGARKQYKKLSDMTQEEKDALSAKEIELQERQEKLEADDAAWKQGQAAEAKKQVEARRDAIITKLAGGKADIIAKMKENFGKLNPDLVAKATTEAELTTLATDSYNMLGSIKPAAVAGAVAASGAGEAGSGGTADFSESADGKALAGALGLPTEDAKK